MRRIRGQFIRDIVIFGVGIAGIIYETIFQQIDRPELLLAFLAMIGLPPFLRSDEKRRDDADEGE